MTYQSVFRHLCRLPDRRIVRPADRQIIEPQQKSRETDNIDLVMVSHTGDMFRIPVTQKFPIKLRRHIARDFLISAFQFKDILLDVRQPDTAEGGLPIAPGQVQQVDMGDIFGEIRK